MKKRSITRFRIKAKSSIHASATKDLNKYTPAHMLETFSMAQINPDENNNLGAFAAWSKLPVEESTTCAKTDIAKILKIGIAASQLEPKAINMISREQKNNNGVIENPI